MCTALGLMISTLRCYIEPTSTLRCKIEPTSVYSEVLQYKPTSTLRCMIEPTSMYSEVLQYKPTSGKALRAWSKGGLWEFCKCNIFQQQILSRFAKYPNVNIAAKRGWKYFWTTLGFRCYDLPIGGSAPLKFAMFISKSRISGWAGGKKTILKNV